MPCGQNARVVVATQFHSCLPPVYRLKTRDATLFSLVFFCFVFGFRSKKTPTKQKRLWDFRVKDGNGTRWWLISYFITSYYTTLSVGSCSKFHFSHVQCSIWGENQNSKLPGGLVRGGSLRRCSFGRWVGWWGCSCGGGGGACPFPHNFFVF